MRHYVTLQQNTQIQYENRFANLSKELKDGDSIVLSDFDGIQLKFILNASILELNQVETSKRICFELKEYFAEDNSIPNS